MVVAPAGVPSDDLQKMIQAARADLAAAGAAPSMRRDPYRAILAALSDTLAVFGRSVGRWERAVADVIAARDPLPEEDRAALVAGLISATEDGAYRGMRKEAARVVRTMDRRLAAHVGLFVASAYVLGAVSVIGVLAFTHLGPFSAAVQRHDAWTTLVQNNPDPRPALASAEVRADETGRRYYAKLSLWMDPARPPPAAP